MKRAEGELDDAVADGAAAADTANGGGPAPLAVSSAALQHPGARALPSQRGAPSRRWQNQFLPTLFDRLCDDAPHQDKELPEAYAPSRNGLRAIVQRDLSYLLNTTNQADLIDPDRHPQVLSSTVNYGVPALSGGYLSDRRWADIEKMIRTAILDYEPRLLPDSVAVQPLMKDEGRAHYNVLLFEIHATLHMEPYPVEFTVQSSVDLETSRITFKEG